MSTLHCGNTERARTQSWRREEMAAGAETDQLASDYRRLQKMESLSYFETDTEESVASAQVEDMRSECTQGQETRVGRC